MKLFDAPAARCPSQKADTVRFSFVLLLSWLLGLLAVGLPQRALADANGIVAPQVGASVAGRVQVVAVAQGPDFAKWQLDLLPAGDAERAIFLALGEVPAPAPSPLAAFDSTAYPDGPYALRLRVVRRDGNYDEYHTPVVLANRGKRSVAGRDGHGAAVFSRTAAQLGLPAHDAAGRPILYLTFDDGPSQHLTPQVVEVLARYDAQATFFVIGRHVQRAPAALRTVAEAGHCIANHTHIHRSLRGLAAEEFVAEVRSAEEAVRAALGAQAPPAGCGALLRPPGGRADAATFAAAADLGYTVVLWDIDPKDWRRPGADAIAETVLRRAFPGAVVVLHDGGGSQQTVAAVETILRELTSRGYVFHALAPP